MKKTLRAYSNVGRMRLNMRLRRQVIGNYPVKAYIEPTLFCNLRCPACPTGLQFGLRPSATLNTDLFKQTLDEISPYVFELYMYNWGEPLLHKQTPEMIRYAKDKGVEKIRLSSNFSIPFTDDYVERLVRSGLSELIVSLDGTSPETYSHYRRKGEFELVRSNMRRVHEAKVRLGSETPEVVWQFLVFRHNEHEISRARAEYREWGADRLDVYGAEMPNGEGAEGFAPSTITEHNIYHPDHPNRRLLTDYKLGGQPCSWLYGIFLLNPNGKVSPCCAVSDEKDDFAELSLGGSLRTAWNSTRFRQARGGRRAPQTGEGSKRKYASLPVLGATPVGGELICDACPIPFRQAEALDTIEGAAEELRRSFHLESSPWTKGRLLLAYLLMGAPGARRRLPDFLTLGAPNLRVFARTLGHVLLHAVPRAK
jgi:MoaA/NifB/PqqE/SkfB family radical SAM enzyme